MQHFARHPTHIPQHGNACKHIIRAPKLYVLEQRNVVVMSRSWPAFSLDANHFEHLLDDFQRHLNIFQPRPATTDELSSYVLLMWYDVSITFINRLIHSMKKM